MKRKIAAILACTMLSAAIFAESVTASEFEYSTKVYTEDYYSKEVDYSLWEKFIKYDLCITDYDSLTDKEKELCKFIFETEQSSNGTVICERARRTLAGDTHIGERITLEQLEGAYGIWDNYSSYKIGYQSFIHCVPDIKCLDGWEDYNEYWTDDEGTYRIRCTGENSGTIKKSVVYTSDESEKSIEIEFKDMPEFVYDSREDGTFFKSDEYLEYNGDYYYIKSDGTAVFAKSKYSRREEPVDYEPVTETVVIPDEVNGYPVTAIETHAFYNACVTEVILPETIEFIDGFAFMNCVYLEKINFPQSLKYIGTNAFVFCTELKEITINNPELYFSDWVFNNCRNITDLNINVRNIGENAFSNCISLKNVTLGESVKVIGSKAFYNCGAIENIQLPSSLKFIGTGAFAGRTEYGRNGIKSITVPSDVEIIGVFPRKTGVGATSGIYVPATDHLTETPLCVFDSDCVISGWYDTEAHNYALENNLAFISLNEDIMYGDTNRDGSVGIADAVLLQKCLTCEEQLTGYEADFNKDGRINVFDVAAFRRYLIM